MPWIEMTLRGKRVFARCDKDGTPVSSKDGRVDILYSYSDAAKQYRASHSNLGKVESGTIHEDFAETPKEDTEIDKDTIVIYTDGACSGNPGPMGIGAVILRNGSRQEISEFLGPGTNNIAELTAILRALESIPPEHRSDPIKLHSDSSYSLGLLQKGWKAKKNQELVAELRNVAAQFSHLEFIKVKGHAGIPENERCDFLATNAIQIAQDS